jgi:cell division transport system permease protein
MLRHSLIEGLHSVIRHPLVTLASVTTVALMLTLMGAFSAFSLNARTIMEQAGQQPPVEITLQLDVSQQSLTAVSQALADHPDVLEYAMHTPEDNFQAFRDSMDKGDLFDDFPVTSIPYTFTVRLIDPARGKDFQAEISGLPGVRKVSLELSVMQFLSRAIVWVDTATLIAFVALGVVSLFIISNMVRVAVFARGEEISIMKYIGATNWYIRVPYIFEGALVGLFGALLAWLLIWLAYGQLYDVLMVGTRPGDVLAMVAPGLLARQILLLNLIIGIGVGASGSALSVRRHIQV